MQDLNRSVMWPFGKEPLGASTWPKMAGLLSSGGASRYAFAPNYFCPHIIVKGQGMVQTGQGRHELSPGDMFTLWPGEQFEYFERPGALWEFHWLHIEGPGCEAFLKACGFTKERPWLRPTNPAEVERILYKIWTLMTAREGMPKAMALLYGLPDACGQANTKSQERMPLVEEASMIMETMMHTGMNIKQVADCCGVGRITLFRAFKQRFGYGPAIHFERMRMEKAKELLKNTSRPLASVAMAVGFSDVRYFSRRFKELEGIPPTACRKTN